MSQQPVWDTAPGSLGTVPEGKFYRIAVNAYDPEFINDPTVISYSLLSGSLPSGIQVQRNGTIEGIPVSIADVKGVPTEVAENTKSKFTIRATSAANRINDRTFTLTITGQDTPVFITNAGSIGIYEDGDPVDFQFEYKDNDPGDVVTIKLLSGELPSGLTLTETGLLTGFVEPFPDTNFGFDLPQLFDEFGDPILTRTFDNEFDFYDEVPWEFLPGSLSKDYLFTLEITDGKNINTRNFSMFVQSQAEPKPFIRNYVRNLGTVRHDNFYTHKIEGDDVIGFNVMYRLLTPLPELNLTLDTNTGWLTGYLPDINLRVETYTFNVEVYVINSSGLEITSNVYKYDLTISGDIEASVFWSSDSDLGAIINGQESTLFVEALHETLPLEYQQVAGNLPAGVELLSSGILAGRVDFETFNLDSGRTTFDAEFSTRLSNADPLTFDLVYTFTANAYSSDKTVSIFKEFIVSIDKQFNTPFNSIYAKALLNTHDRDAISSMLSTIDFNLLYRLGDENFAAAKNLTYTHAYGLTPANIEDYYLATKLNHYNKQLVLGELKTARALDENGLVQYEVVYSQIIDNLVNPNSESVSSKVDTFTGIINDGSGKSVTVLDDFVYPNSLKNMRDNIIDTIGQESKLLPRWMLSKQENGNILGFTPAWVIAYTKPGQSKLLSYQLTNDYLNLNQIDFTVDRFTLENRYTHNWDIVYTADSTRSAPWTGLKTSDGADGWHKAEITCDSSIIYTDATNTADSYEDLGLSLFTVDNAFFTADSNLTADSVTTEITFISVDKDGALVPLEQGRTGYDNALYDSLAYDETLTVLVLNANTKTQDRFDKYIKFPQTNIVK